MAPSESEPRVLVFVPTLNDVEHLATIVGQVADLGPRYRCLIIDDGSVRPVERDLVGGNAMICRLPANFGLGVCTEIAIAHGVRYGYEAVVRIDADGQHPVARIPDLIEQTRQGGFDIVVGTRVNRYDGMGARAVLRRAAHGYFRLIVWLLTRGRCPHDVNTGFFCLSRDGAAALLGRRFNRFPEPELFVIAHRLHLKTGEIKIVQEKRLTGQSTLTGLAAARMIVRFTLFAIAEVLRGKP